MKRQTVMLMLLAASVLMCSCESQYTKGYDVGYNKGYDEGVVSISRDNEYNYMRGYDDGYKNGFEEASAYPPDTTIRQIERDATQYAMHNSEWHPEEAWCIIDAYQNGGTYEGRQPSHRDYLDAIDTMICFYEYFYGWHYE